MIFDLNFIKNLAGTNLTEFFNIDYNSDKKKCREIMTRFGTKNVPLVVFADENLEEYDAIWSESNPDWELEIKKKGLKKGPRDFFFHNAHVGEFFSVIEMIYPWESRSWMNVNINRIQQNHL